MQVYLVGGAVRDALLGLAVSERDYVITGASPEVLLGLGYKQVGHSFPVFLHPDSGEEYALARTERKSGSGHGGFICDFGPEVSLETDLARRDLTINAIAQSADGQLIDPYGGLDDLARRQLRHVSPAFVEDPLRVLRVARFAARFAPLGFSVASDTLSLMRTISASGELQTLSAERLWQESAKALAGPAPWVYFKLLHQVGALDAILPELARLWGVPNPPLWHPEIDTGVHTLMVLRAACQLSSDPAIRFAALCHDLGKGTTPPAEWPSHKGHDERSARLVVELAARWRIPNPVRDLAELVARHHGRCHRLSEMGSSAVIRFLDDLDGWRRPERLLPFVLACTADYRGRSGYETASYPQAQRLLRALEIGRQVSVQTIVAAGYSGPAVGQQLHQRRIAALRRAERAQAVQPSSKVHGEQPGSRQYSP